MKEGVGVAWEKVCIRRHVEFSNHGWECLLRASGDTSSAHLDFMVTCLLPDGWRPSLQKTSPSLQELLLTLLDLRPTTACLKFCVPYKWGGEHPQGLFAAPGILVLQHNPSWSKHLFMWTPTTRKEDRNGSVHPNCAGLNVHLVSIWAFSNHLLCWSLHFPHIVKYRQF